MEKRIPILLISPNCDLQGSCREALDAGRFSLTCADSLSAGFGMRKEDPFELVLLDARVLQDRQETSLLSELRKEDEDCPCIVLSENASLDLALATTQAGAYDVVVLPLIPEVLLLRVSRALEKRRHSLELKRLRAFEHEISQLWSVAKGELEASDLFDKDFLAPAAFRLTVAHEFRAPLTALQSFLLILLKGYVAPEKWNEMIQHAYDRSQDLLDLVDDLMNLATARQEMSLENRSLISLGDELDKVMPTLQAEAEGKGLTITREIRRNPLVEMNASHPKPLWTNLISNAIKYTPSGGQIHVGLDQEGEWAVGTVEDTGIGISPEQQPLIFHEFFRTREAKNMARRGTGLGLALVKRIVEGYHGRIEVVSAPGKGSRFRFTLPLATRAVPCETKQG
jgi:signal transduction histidine kinase